MTNYTAALKDYVTSTSKYMTREPDGILKYPYIVPCARQPVLLDHAVGLGLLVDQHCHGSGRG